MTHVKWTALYNHWLSSAQGKDEAGGSIGEPLHVDTVKFLDFCIMRFQIFVCFSSIIRFLCFLQL